MPQRGEVEGVWPGMPTTSTSPPGRATPSAWVSESAEPTQSMTTSAPPVGRPPTTNEPVAARMARPSSFGSATQSAPSSVASFCWAGCFAVAMIVVAIGVDPQGGDRQQPEGAGADDRDGPTGGRSDRAVHRAGGRLDHHGLLVGHRLRAPAAAATRGRSAA